jgi:hypothetical protein
VLQKSTLSGFVGGRKGGGDLNPGKETKLLTEDPQSLEENAGKALLR